MNSISKKVLIGYVFVLMVAIAASVTLFGVASEVNQRTNHFIGQTLPELDTLQEMRLSLDSLQISAYGFYGTVIEESEFSRVISDNKKQFDRLLKTNSMMTAYQESKPIMVEITTLFAIMERLQGVMTADSVDWDSARNILVEVDEHSKNIAFQLNKIKEDVSSSANSSSKEISTEIANIQLLVLALLASIVTVAIVAYAYSHKKIALPIRELAKELDHVAQDYDLTVTVPENSKDEIGIAAGSVNRLLKAFLLGINDVRSVANNINGLVSVLAQSSENADDQVKLLNEKIESLLSRMMTLEDQIKLSFQQSNNVSQKAEKGAQEVEKGAQQVAKASVGISSLASDIEISSEMLLELRKSGDNVSAVVGTIAEIADQTNLLALNAAIEAARAGETGRGFAVVADEVRTLATRTHQSTIEINAMLEGIVGSISQVVCSMENNQIKASEAVELSQQTVESLSVIQATIMTLSKDSDEVANQAKHSHNQVIDMREWVEHFKTVGDAVLKGSMETHDISVKMTELAISFNQSVERFRT
ncbi:methyl-accepting chemotaxis protein [Colwellia sp. MSW7]|uniref:Methyl-accepting chemotaxis protein n=1 Tax=Colwellia maritima TaxID=2912588 RepID=A0ABS9X3N5_9GAMM|nr:methyl-accepting chemotaxis protein [Colwellia maritima]MCI2284412.1 methyl-accepting chemotaxis protein [Colwellia maritima]